MTNVVTNYFIAVMWEDPGRSWVSNTACFWGGFPANFGCVGSSGVGFVAAAITGGVGGGWEFAEVSVFHEADLGGRF